jgi:DNA-binding PadR family transcriptional regulator
MKGTYLGELEELILLTVGVLYEKAYGVTIKEEIENQVGRKLNISAVHAVLKRLEDKGLIISSMGGATAERGGRRKRLFNLTALGKSTLEEAKEMRNQLYNQIPKVALQFNHLSQA